MDATACDSRRVQGGHRFDGFGGWPGETGLFGDHGRSFGGAPWPGGFAGCPGLGLTCFGSDMSISVEPRESAVPVQPATSRQDLFQAPVPGVPIWRTACATQNLYSGAPLQAGTQMR